MIIEAREDTVRLYGDLQQNEWLTIKAAANLLLKNHPRGIIIDCTHLDDVTETGAGTFLDAIRYIEGASARIVVAGVPGNVMEQVRSVPGLRSSLPVASTVDEARRSLKLSGGAGEASATRSRQSVMVALLGDSAAEHATTTACRLGNDVNAEIHLAFFIVVPRNQPLTAPQPEAEASADALLDRCETIVKRHNLKAIRHIEPVRDVAEGVVSLSEKLGVSMVVCNRTPSQPGSAGEDATQAILRKSACEVVVDHVPQNSR